MVPSHYKKKGSNFMRKIYFKGHEITSEDYKNLDYRQGNYLDKVCDAFYDLTKEEQENGVNYGDFFIIEE